jgi:hypothetical protein
MTVEIATGRPPATAGCGCGGKDGCGGRGGCGCGAGAARTPTGGFVRPRFFAGQLLTEEDLEQLSAYVVGKNRLRNRFLHGDGVVCGLEVACHPCGAGRVVVGAGYALDCCGNDIVVPCPEELDILEMIHELRIAIAGGCDCGDPCAHKTKDPPKQQDEGRGQEGDEQEPKEQEARRYWLYLRYTEHLSDPVAPYATDEPCGAQGCEATRVREGYQFVLRSSRTTCEDDDISDRLLDCLGDPRKVLHSIESSRWARQLTARLRAALRAMARDDALAASRAELEGGVMARVRSFADSGQAAPDEASARQLVDDLVAAAGLVARAKGLDAAARGRAGIDDKLLDDASGTLRTAAQRVRDAGVVALLDEQARPYAEAGLRAAARAADQPAGEPLSGGAKLLARGVPADGRLLTATVSDLRAQRAWLLDKVEHTRTPTDCKLAAEVAAVRIPVLQRAPGEGEGEEGVVTEESGDQLATTAERLAELTRRYLLACACAAINPPCRSCPDDAVLLAGIDVLDCEVEDICQVVRRYVVSGPSLRYWLPPLGWLQQLLERWCCTDELIKDQREAKDDVGEPVAEPSFLAAGHRPVPAAATARDRALLAVGAEFERLGPAEQVGAVVLPGLSPGLLRADLTQVAAQSPDVRRLVGAIAVDAVTDRLGDVQARARGHLQELAAELTGAAAIDREVDSAVTSQMAAVRRDLGQYKSQASRQLGRLEATVQERLTELDRQLSEVAQLRERLEAAQPAPPGQPPQPRRGGKGTNRKGEQG